MRPRADTIGGLGRSPARASKEPPTTPLPPRPEPPSERSRVRKWVHGALFDNLGLKFLSMVLAVTVFLLVNTDRDREITKRVAVSYTLPDDKVLTSERLNDIQVTIRGPSRRINRLDDMDPINIDLRHAASGDVPITPDMFHLPSGLAITSITPHAVPVVFDRRVEKVVEVAPQVAGHPQHGFVVSELQATPATVKVRGAEGTLRALSSVRTGEVPVEGRAESFVKDTVALPPEGVEVISSPNIQLHVTIDEELVSRKLPGLEVTPRGDNLDASKWTITPNQVEVTLTGPLLAVEKAKAAIVPVAMIKPSGAPADKSREVDVSIEGRLPPGIGVKISPERVTVAPAK